MSLSGSLPAMVALPSVPSAKITLSFFAAAATCSAVRIVPSSLITTPVPVLVFS